MKTLVVLAWILAILMATEVVQAADIIDPTNGNKASEVTTNDVQIPPDVNAAAVTILDNFNRANGPIGSAWTNRAGAFMVSNNAAVGSPSALATYNGLTTTIAEADVQSVGTGLEYVGLVLGYKDISNNLFMKVQNQDGDNKFEYASCYVGNNGGGFGKGFFSLTSGFNSAHMRVELVGSTVTMTFSRIDGGTGTQTYTCTGAPTTGGSGAGIVGYSGISRIDNFAAATTAAPSITLTTDKASYTRGQTIQLSVAVSNPTTTTYSSRVDVVIILPGGTTKTIGSKTLSLTAGMNAAKTVPIAIPTSAPTGSYQIKGTLTYGTSTTTSTVPITIT